MENIRPQLLPHLGLDKRSAAEHRSASRYHNLTICMHCSRSLLRLNIAKRVDHQPQLSFASSKSAPCRHTFVTLANQHRPPAPASPTRPLQRLDKIQQHFSSSTSPSTTSKSGLTTMAYTTRKVAAANTLEHRVFIEKDGVPISAWHDIPLYANEQQTILNMVVEVPRWTNAKMEVRILPWSAIECRTDALLPRDCDMSLMPSSDFQGGDPQPHQAGHQERQAPLRPQLLPPQGLPLELRCLPSGTILSARYRPYARHRVLTAAADMGGSQRHTPRDQGQR